MRGDCSTNGRAITLHEVEHARRNAGSIHHFSKDSRVAWAFFGGLQHHGVASRYAGGDLECNLVQRPVPWRNQPDNADGFVNYCIRTDLFFERKLLKCGQRAKETAKAGRGLRHGGKADRRTHFGRHRFGEIGNPLFIFLDDAVHQRDALFAARLAEGLECLPCSCNRCIHVGLRAEGDFGARLFGRRADNLVALATNAVDPFAVDIMLQIAVHVSLLKSQRVAKARLPF